MKLYLYAGLLRPLQNMNYQLPCIVKDSLTRSSGIKGNRLIPGSCRYYVTSSALIIQNDPLEDKGNMRTNHGSDQSEKHIRKISSHADGQSRDPSDREKDSDQENVKEIDDNHLNIDNIQPQSSPAENDDEDIGDERDLLTTIFEDQEPYMDTYYVHCELVRSGFTPEQSNELINYLIKQLNTKLSKLNTKYSQKYELENESYLFISAQQELRVDITRSMESHMNELLNLIHVLERDFSIIADELNNDFIQMKNNTQVVMNDQKSDNTLHTKSITLRIQETNHKITTELHSAMKSEVESLRWHISRWGLIGILIAVFSGCTMFYVHKMKSIKIQTREEMVPLVIYEPSELDDDDYHTDLDENDIH